MTNNQRISLIAGGVLLVLIALVALLLWRPWDSSLNREALAPNDLVHTFLAEVSEGDIEGAHELVITSRQGKDSSGLAEVVESYKLEGNKGAEITTATTTATSSVMQGVITRENESRLSFMANFRKVDNIWFINRFVVLGTDNLKDLSAMSTSTARSLAGGTLALVAGALETNDFREFYDHLGPTIKESNTIDDLQRAYNNLNEEEQSQIITAIRQHNGAVTTSPSLNRRGHTGFVYTYASSVPPIAVEMVYENNFGFWRLVEANFSRADE